MADLVLGLAKSVLEGTLSKATAAIEAETTLRQSAKRNLVFITGEFRMMQSFLLVANKERVENAVVRDWVRQIRELAYDVEDCVEFVIHLDTKSSWLWSRRLIPSFCLTSPLPLDIATQELEELKARVEEVSRRNHNYNLISDTGSKPVVVQQQPAATGATTALSNSILIGGARGSGRRQQGDLTQLLSDPCKDLRVISVWGSGGSLGVTSIIWNAFQAQEIRQNFTCRAWMKLVQPFDPAEFLRCVTDQFYTNGSNQKEDIAEIIGLDTLNWSKSSEHQTEFARRVSKERYLVVLEGLSSMTNWDAITKFFPQKKNGSCIIISTQQTEVASLSVGRPYQAMELNQFSDEHSVYAFYKEGSQCEEETAINTLGNAPTMNSKNEGADRKEGSQYKEVTPHNASTSNSKNKDTDQKEGSTCDGDNPSSSFCKKKAAEDWIARHPFVGRELETEALRQYTTNTRFDQIQILSVWGTVGVEKSVFVKKMFCDRILSDCNPDHKNKHVKFDKYGWVDVIRPLDLVEFSRRLISSFYSSSIPIDDYIYTDKSGSEDPIEECRGILKLQRCFVVIDGLMSTNDWDKISGIFVSGYSMNRIIVITSKQSVAKYCSGDKKELVIDLENEIFSGKHKEASEWIDKNKLFGRDTEMNDLRRYTTDFFFGLIQYFAIWGIAGVGKSSLVKQLFCEEIINQNPGRRFEKYDWVEILYPFKLRDFSQSLLMNLHSGSLETKESATEANNPIVECRRILNQNKCLIVIDGLQSTDHWDLIQAELLSGSSHNFVITIVTEANIAAHCCGDKAEHVFNVKGLEADVAYDLFKRKVSAGGNPLRYPLPDQDDLDVQELVSKCGGLPKVIVEIASSIGTKTVQKMKTVQSLNNKFIYDLETNQEFDKLQGLLSWVHTYFQSCPDFLKPCIFYLSIFPRDFLIRRRRLLRRWIAEGYSRDNHEEFAEQSSEKQFCGLLDLSLIQQQPQKIAIISQSNTRKILYQVNGFIREYIVSKRMEEDLVFELEGSSIITTQRTGRHLVVLKSWKRDKILFESMEFNLLRSLTVFGGWESFFISDSMRLLRVLDLENASAGLTQDDLKKVVKVLLRLKFLSLRGHSEIFHLPGSLHKLRQLETLDVRGTSITTLPEKIIRLQQLQYIRAGTMCVQRPVSSSNNTVQDPAVSSRNNTVPAPAPSSSNNVTFQVAVSPCNCSCLIQLGRSGHPTVSTGDVPATVASSNSSMAAPVPRSCSWLPGFCRFHRPTVGVEVPIGIGRLTALHTLGVVDIAASGENSVVEGLKQLTQLRKLGVSGITRKNSKKFISAIKEHLHLESLSLQFDKENQDCCVRKDDKNKACLDDMLSLPCGNLLSLKLYGIEDKLPSWGDDKLRKLTKMELEMSSLKIDGIKFLGKLPELCILRLKQLQDGQLLFLVREHGEEDHSYKKLKVLEIGSSSEKISVTFGSKALKELELLKVDCPSASSFQFTDMKNLRKLKEVRLVKVHNHKTQERHLTEQLKELFETHLQQNSNQIKPVLVLEEAPHSP